MDKIKRIVSLLLIFTFTIIQVLCLPTFAIENKKSNLTSQFQLKQSINEKNYTVGDTFDISYDIGSLIGINKNEYDDANSKDKEIVLLVDTSGSMIDRKVEGKYRINYSVDQVFIEKEWKWYTRVSLENGQKYIIHELLYTPEGAIIINGQIYTEYIEIDNKRYYLKYDYSDGSWYAIAYSESKIDELQKAAKNFVNKFETKANTKIGLVSYGNKGKVVHSLTNELDRINSSIDYGLSVYGATNIGDGIRKANGLLNNGSNADKYIVLMTDGIPTAATCYSNVKSERTEHYSNFYRRNIYDAPGGAILDEYGRELEKFNLITDYNYKFEYNPKDYIYSDENIIINRGDNDYGNIALNYAKESLKRASENGVNNFVVGFSNGISRDKLTQIADAGNGYYREAMHGDELEDVYNRIADEINNPVVKDIEFKLNLPDGLVIEDIVSNSSKESLKDKLNVSISKDGRSIKFKLDNISYNEEKDENGNIKYVVSKDQLEKFKFSIKVKANKSGEYTIGDKDSYGGINYTDVDGQHQEKPFGKETFTIKDDKAALSVENMGVFYEQNGKILNKDIKLMNGFRYQVGTVINIGDGQKAQDFIENDSILKSSISGIKTIGKSNLKLYSVEGNKIQLVKNIQKSGDNGIKIPKNTLKKNGKYILVEDIINISKNEKDKNNKEKSFELKNIIELQNDKNKAVVNGNMNFKALNSLPNVD